MVTNLIHMASEKKSYTALQYNGRLFRMENGSMGVWRLHGGAYNGDDFAKFKYEDIFKFVKHKYEGIGKNSGKSLRELATTPIQLAHSLIVSPIETLRAAELTDDISHTFVLSGIVQRIERVPEPISLDEVMRYIRN